MKHLQRLIVFILVLPGLVCSSCRHRLREGFTYEPSFIGEIPESWFLSGDRSSFGFYEGFLINQGTEATLLFGDMKPIPIKGRFMIEGSFRTSPEGKAVLFFQPEGKHEASRIMEIMVNNDKLTVPGDRLSCKTGSILGVHNLFRAFVPHNEWFDLKMEWNDGMIELRVNNQILIDTHIDTDFTGMLLAGWENPHEGGVVECRMLRFTILPGKEGLNNNDVLIVRADSIGQVIRKLHAIYFPLVDFHTHLKGNLNIEKALDISSRSGIGLGIAPNCGKGFPITDDAGIFTYLDRMAGRPVFLGMQAEGREWVDMFSMQAVSAFDYVFTDAMTYTDDKGRRMRLWMPDEVFVDEEQAFMETLVSRLLGILDNEPIDIYVNPTYLPEVLAGEYERLWTEERMQKVIDALKRNGIALEINSRLRLPSEKFIRMAHGAGVKFSLGTNNVDSRLGRSEYGLEMIMKLNLGPEDMFVPFDR